ncbi:autotransporter domain-containing protein [Castellaniella sp.]|uniref:autotransporter domain-containing protein n=1 Tax=Castellaniella sp. TaxID=1955812 RepID=UPI002AFF07C1|nr:autotransporter domain-containing protein [Castellaniella sp.]
MTPFNTLLILVITAAALPATAAAQAPGFFAGLDVSGGIARGSSSTQDGGAAFAGGGVVENVKFGNTTGIGGHVGYQIDPAVSAFISYQYTRGDIDWDAHFPRFGVASSFSGDATSHTILANIAYDWPLSEATTIRATAGLGVTFNTLSGVTEREKPSSAFASNVADHTEAGPTGQLGAAIQHYITPNAMLSLNVSAAYVGAFRTGDTREGNLGVTQITPYEIRDTWRMNLGASVRMRF